MPPRSRAAAAKASSTSTPEFYEWDELVEEAQVNTPPFRMRVPVLPPEPDAKGKVPEVDPDADTHEFIEIPIPSGANYINVVSARARGDAASVIIGLTNVRDDDEAGEQLFYRVLQLFEKADFPVVDKFAAKVLAHYFNAPPKSADGGEAGAGE